MVQPARTILIVDDSPEDQELYRRYLLRDRDHSYTILEASLGQKGLELWHKYHPDLVLLDYRLPDLDGLEFLSQLQCLSEQSCFPVIMLTGQGNEAIAVQAMKAGAQDYLLKGQMTPEGFHRAIHAAMETVQLRVQLQQRIEREQLVAQITLQIHQSQDLEEILQTAVTEIRRFLQVDRVLVVRIDSDSSHVVVAESVVEPYRSVLSANVYDPCFKEGYIEQYRQGRVMAKSDIYDGSLVSCHVDFLAQFQIRANLVVPILRDNQLWGLLAAHYCAAPRVWQTIEIEFVQQLAVHLGIALQQANAYAQLKQQSEARYQAIVEAQTDFIIRFLPDMTVLFVNRAYCQHFQLKPDEIIGQSFSPIILEADRDRVFQQINSITPENPTVTIENQVRINGEIHWTQWICQMLLDQEGQCTEYQAVGRDITLLKAAEAQLRHSNERIRLANAELARAAQLKDDFLANMSHELRTPLNSILGLSEGLLEEVFGSLTHEQRQYLKTIEQSAEHLLTLINDILDLSKIESGNIELELRPVAVYPICQSSLKFVKQQARHKQIQLSYALDESIFEIEVDERRFLQVLVNLLSNAVKFTPDGGYVSLEVRQHPSQNAIEFRVTDTGIGIAKEHLNQIFQPFIQVDSSLSREYTGTGLGLPIVKRIVDLHGGSIRVESEVGRGSCFTVILPWQPCPTSNNPGLSEGTAQPSDPQSPSGAKESRAIANPIQGKLLLVEDNEANITTLFNYLEAHHFQVVLACNGIEGVQMANQHQPDLILMDIQMPGMDGLEATRQIRANPRTTNIPIIALTALTMPGDLERCLEAGANDYFSKPVRLKQLVERIIQLLPQCGEVQRRIGG